MKKKMMAVLAVSAGFILCSYSAHAQVAFGVKGGVSNSTVSFDIPNQESPEVTSVTNFTGGIFTNLTLPLLPFSIQPEVLYVSKGAKRITTETILGAKLTRDQTVELEYIEVPILAKFNLPIPVPIKPNIFVGPAVSFLIGSEQTVIIKDELTNTTDESKTNPIPDTNKNDFGIVFGAGVDFNLFLTKMTLDGRYNLGLSKVNTNEDFTTKNRAWMIMLGVAF